MTVSRTVRARRVLVAGTTPRSEVLASRQLLSFWGGVDPATGVVIDRRHPWHGQSISQRVLVLPKGKGSSTGSYVLLDAWASGTGPAALLLNHVDEIIALGAVVHEELNNRAVPVLVLDDESFAVAVTSRTAVIHLDGTVSLDDE